MATTEKPTVFIVDDDSSVRRSLERLLKSAGYRAEAFSSASEFLDSGRHRVGPGCAILDIQMPGLNGLELHRELAKLAPSVPIIFITGHGDIPTSVRAMKEGAIDFLPKPFQDEALLHAVAMALDRSIRERTEYAEKQLIQQRVDMLTPREREVLEFVVTGMLNKQIARKLGTTEKTIKVHRGRVMEKMCVDSVAQLVRAAEKVRISPATPKS